ncbi:hypothetical protein [Mycolicibacterium mengxianglii]|uniref:hypothetical protein n=1 Tax=Mycolicibacterium mengxianglii TaxID=2736649 RepID=UPI0018D1B8CA|nr:hypothetical protein [Mycolicibacterium mengxianglii]
MGIERGESEAYRSGSYLASSIREAVQAVADQFPHHSGAAIAFARESFDDYEYLLADDREPSAQDRGCPWELMTLTTTS